MSDPRLNQIRIKTGVLKRVVKEKSVYEQEIQIERSRLMKMINENKDQYDIRKQEEVLNETILMLPDCEKRIYCAYNDLKGILQETAYELSGSEEFQLANVLIQQINFSI